MASKWDGLDGPGFRFEDLGRPAVFLIPVSKLQKRLGGKSAAEDLDHFLTENFGAFTRMTISNFGVWVNGQKTIICDECGFYEVSFVGKERITLLARKLAELASAIGEECIYFKAGQYAALIYPRTASSQPLS
mgnify:FL=1